MMKKRITKPALVVLSTLLVTSLLVGCGKNEVKDPQTPTSNNQPMVVDYPEKLTLWRIFNSDKDYMVNIVNTKVEEATGTKVEYLFPTGDQKQALNLLLASNKWPDVIEANWLEKGPDQMIKEKTIIRLNELIEQHAPNLTKLLNENPEWRKAITTDEGNIYTMPFIRGDLSLGIFVGPIIREDWLDKVNMEAPTTIDEWHAVLTAFKEKDPNGNGKPDEIPLLLQTSKGSLLTQFGLVNAFAGAWGVNTDYTEVDGKIQYGPIQPEFKQFLTTLNQWYNEGLIDKEFASNDDKLRDAKVTGDIAGSFVGYLGGGLGRYLDLMKDQNPNFDLAGTPFPVLNKGDEPILGFEDLMFKGYGAAITSSNKNPEATIKYMDFFYGEEGSMLKNFGIEGETYTIENGMPTFNDFIFNNPDNLSAVDAKIRSGISTGEGAGVIVQDKRAVEQGRKPQQDEAVKLWSQPSNDRLLPLLTQLSDEDKKIKPLQADIDTHFEEMFVKFVMGVEPIENFDKYVSQLKALGVDEVVSLKQAALDRYNKK